MKVFLKNVIIKKILVVFITIIMVSNFIMPNYVCAADPGKQLVSGFFYLLSYVGDAAISLMQTIFKGDGDITDNGEYRIRYSPGIIFSDEVSALKINFINAQESDNDIVNPVVRPDDDGELKDILKRLNLKAEKGENIGSERVGEFRRDSNGELIYVSNFGKTIEEDTGRQFRYSSLSNDNNLIVISTSKDLITGWIGLWDNDVDAILSKDYFAYSIWYYNGYVYTLSEEALYREDLGTTIGQIGESSFVMRYNTLTLNDSVELKSTAYQLKNNIATWYIALRTIALVGLLSVLVYLGIRIILSSTSAQDKAKYKNMLKDWVVAICILFLLHYVMAFMLNITDNLNQIIKSNVIAQTSNANDYDVLISKVRNEYEASANDADTPLDVAGYTVMYLALVILTGVFTIQYLKRVIFMAFLTMIAPMIALTYPLDKVKDGKAQAFSYWLREYIFNCLIQPVHLLLYTVLITNAITFATDNVLYAIVALGFLVPAEKFIKEMFGMKSSSPTGQLGAAAGGAMVMSMLNKIKAKPPKDDAGSGASSNSNSIRDASGANTSGGDAGTGLMDKNNLKTNPPLTPSNKSGVFQKLGQTKAGQVAGRVATGVGGAVGRGAGRLIKNQANMLTSGIKLTGKAIKSLPGAALGATVGLVATVASGGEKAGTFIGGGAMAGAALSQNLTDSTFNGVGTEIQKGWYGEEGYKTRQAKKEFFGSDAYRQITGDKTLNQTNIRQRVENLIDNGITDGKEMKELLQAGITGEGAKEYKDAGVTSAKAMREFASNGIDAERLREIKLATGETDTKKMLRYNAIANAAKSKNKTDPIEFINWARTTYKMDDDAAQKLLNQCKHYW